MPLTGGRGVGWFRVSKGDFEFIMTHLPVHLLSRVRTRTLAEISVLAAKKPRTERLGWYLKREAAWHHLSVSELAVEQAVRM